MKSVLLVGNDVVDLSNPRVRGKSGDSRFTSRVVAHPERPGVTSATDPDLELWCLWAAKEAAYKIVSKTRATPPVFAHAEFVVTWGWRARAEGGHESTVRKGIVTYGGTEVTVEVSHDFDVLHAVARYRDPLAPHQDALAGLGRLDDGNVPWEGDLDALRARLSPREAEPVHSRASAAVRLGARAALARAMRVEESRVEIVCDPGLTGRRPPRVLLDGSPARADVSLSHDGPWIAWALWAGPGALGRAGQRPSGR